MEAEFERLSIEYVSSQTRDTIRESQVSSLCSSRRSSMTASNASTGDAGDPLLRFLL